MFRGWARCVVKRTCQSKAGEPRRSIRTSRASRGFTGQAKNYKDWRGRFEKREKSLRLSFKHFFYDLRAILRELNILPSIILKSAKILAVTRKQSISVTMTTAKLTCRWVMIALRLFLHIPSLNHSCHVGLELALNNWQLLDEVEQKVGICQVTGEWLRQIIHELRDTDKSRYFAITEFNNCFIIRSPSLFCNEYLREGVRAHCLTCMRSNISFPFCSFMKPNTVGRHCAWADHYV